MAAQFSVCLKTVVRTPPANDLIMTWGFLSRVSHLFHGSLCPCVCVWPAHHHFDCHNLAISVRIRRCNSSECHSLVHRCDKMPVHSVHGRKDVFRFMTSETLSPLRKEGITVARALQQTCSTKSVRTGARLYDFMTVSPHMYCLYTTWAQRPWRQGGVGILGTRVTDDCGCWELNLVLCKSSKAPGPQ